MSKFKIQVRGACLRGNCDCARRDGMIVGEGDIPPFCDGCTCVAVPCSRLDEIRERYEWSKRASRTNPTGMSTAVEDIGYLLGLLEEHPADEPPDTTRKVLAYQKCVSQPRVAYYIKGGDAAWMCSWTGMSLTDIVAWRELPPVPQGDALEGKKKDQVRALILEHRGKHVKATQIQRAYIAQHNAVPSRKVVVAILRELCQEGLAEWGYGGGRNANWFVRGETGQS